MSLTLEIVGPQASQLGAAARKTFQHQGGSIGRANINDWVIPDAYVSGQHARVHFRDGNYFLEDLSTNGVFIKNPGNRLPKGQQYPLQSGDRVFIDAYEIKVTIDGESDFQHPSGRPSLFDAVSKQPSPVATAAIEKIKNTGAHHVGKSIHGIPVDMTIPLPEPSDAIAGAIANKVAYNFASDSPMNVGSSGQFIDFNPFGDLTEEPARLPEAEFASAMDAASLPSGLSRALKGGKKVAVRNLSFASTDTSASPSAKQSIDMQALLANAGVDATNSSPMLAENIGPILHVVIAGIMQMLQTREQARVDFGIRNTSYKKADSNPLKFSVNVEDALHNLLVKRNSAYLGPVEAFEDAFREMRFHELAMLEAMRAAFNFMLQTFSPENLQANFSKETKQASLWYGPVKVLYWDLYRERYNTMTKNADQCFRDMFAEEFVRVYSARIEQLKLNNSDQ